MLGRSLRHVIRQNTVRCFSEAAAPATTVKLNLCLPHEAIYEDAQVYSVILPGAAGEYGVTANHVPYVAQLKPGVVQILHEENTTEPEKYFVPGGYALTHADSSTVRVACVVGFSLFCMDLVKSLSKCLVFFL